MTGMISKRKLAVSLICPTLRSPEYKSMNIPAYFYGTYSNHAPLRDRKLLLTKKELRKLQQKVKEPGFSIIPTAIFINDRGLAKVDIALAKGKKEFDKRQSIKDAEDRRSMDRARKNF